MAGCSKYKFYLVTIHSNFKKTCIMIFILEKNIVFGYEVSIVIVGPTDNYLDWSNCPSRFGPKSTLTQTFYCNMIIK